MYYDILMTLQYYTYIYRTRIDKYNYIYFTLQILIYKSFYSSRFTDSKKYEDDFMLCFQLDERRSGEICNACVLLVKRFKKLPPGNDRNWSHVSI